MNRWAIVNRLYRDEEAPGTGNRRNSINGSRRRTNKTLNRGTKSQPGEPIMLELLNNNTFIFWTAIVLISTVPVVTYYWHKVRRAELDAELKREMIQRGMSADEIE